MYIQRLVCFFSSSSSLMYCVLFRKLLKRYKCPLSLCALFEYRFQKRKRHSQEIVYSYIFYTYLHAQLIFVYIMCACLIYIFGRQPQQEFVFKQFGKCAHRYANCLYSYGEWSIIYIIVISCWRNDTKKYLPFFIK